MGCAADYPTKPCPYGFTGLVTRESCGKCKHFIPPKHIREHCMLWDRDRILCMRPKSDCPTCLERCDRGPGRPAGESPIDWRNPKDVNKYQAELMKKRRTEGKAPETRGPEYWRDYYAKNKQRILERRKARRQGSGEPGSGQV